MSALLAEEVVFSPMYSFRIFCFSCMGFCLGPQSILFLSHVVIVELKSYMYRGRGNGNNTDLGTDEEEGMREEGNSVWGYLKCVMNLHENSLM